MSIVIVGGNDRMVCRYKEICRQYNCKAKVFTQMPADFKKQIGRPDLLVLFTSTVSHKMVGRAVKEVSRHNTRVARCHSSGACALKGILDAHVGGGLQAPAAQPQGC
jgi:hypothetical protein